VSVENASIGAHVVLHGGVRIGADGFGFFFDEHSGVRKKPQLLRVLIGDGVEIGAGTCIDRGSWRDTRIGDETKIDNLVQLGHNVIVGRACLICAHAALAGSSELGDRCVMGGKSAVADHVRLCGGVRLAACSGVTKHISTPGDYAGFPAQPAAAWRRHVAMASRAMQRPAGTS
jgi:UDP-3-O-[3-hydroxymyristoyl] glucosamine N-acyltransferase LpxD